MPGEPRQLYLGKNVGDLNKLAGDFPKINNVRGFIKSADKLYQKAEECKLHGDEEKAYVMYMKYFNIISAVKKTNEYQKDKKFFNDMIGSKKCIKAIDEAERLSKDLNNRYDKQQAEIVSQRLKNVDLKDDAEEEDKEPSKEKPKSETGINRTEGIITPQEVYALMDEKIPHVIFDVRSEEDFTDSHINRSTCISIPRSIIPAGVLTKNIEKNLPVESKYLWHQRSQMEYVIIMDWRSSLRDLVPGNSVNNLKDALYKWDQNTILKREPLILDGGYEEWILHYSPLTTNSQPSRRPQQTASGSSVPSLDDIDYDLDMDILRTPEQIAAEKRARELKALEEAKRKTELSKNINQGQEKELSKQPINAAKMPSIDRSVKPKPISNQQAQVNNAALNNIKVTNNLKDLRQIMNEPVKNTNVTKKQNDNPTPAPTPAPVMPTVDRNLKPATPSKPVMDLEKEKAEYEAIMEKKREAEEEVERLQRLKQEQAKETAQLMRSKRRVEEEMKMREEEKRKQEIEKPESASSTSEKIESLNNGVSKNGQESPKDADTEANIEDGLKEEEERKEKERLEREIKEKQEIKRQAEEKEKKEREAMLEKQREEKLRQEKEERERIEEQNRKEKELAEKEMKKKESNDSAARAERPQGVHHTPGLPVDWEKRLDPSTGRYFYIDHRHNKTQWEPPVTPTSKTAPKDSYFTKLKEEGSGGLTRSHSFSNISKMVNEEESMKKPQIERANKPRPKQDILTLTTDVSAAKVRNLNPTYGSVAPGLCGLRNMGNTCYMNSIIQCLSNTMHLALYFLSDTYKLDINKENVFGKGGVIAEEYCAVNKALWSGQYKCVAPRDLWSTLGRFYSLFASHEHQDSQELLLFLMDGLHEDLNKVKKRPKLPEQNNDGVPDVEAAVRAWKMHKQINQSIIVELFQGQFKSTVTCLTCRRESVTFDAFVNLSLPIAQGSKVTLGECLALFSKKEAMTGESRWDCPRCKCKRDASKCIVIWKLPPILIIHLKRFFYRGMWREKISTHVDYPLENLDMTRYVAGPESRPPYSLYAVSNHYGNLDGGHYTASIKNNRTGRWFRYDDSEVYERSDVQSSAGYILFYSSWKNEPNVQ